MRLLRFAAALLCCIMFPIASCFAGIDDPTGPGNHQSEVTDQPAIYYEAYIHGQGWSNRCREMSAAGDAYGSQTLDAIRINVDLNPYLAVVYRVHSVDGTWSPWAINGATAGTPGTAIDGMEVYFTGRAAAFFGVSYRVLINGKGWTDWGPVGHTAGDLSNTIGSFRMRIE